MSYKEGIINYLQRNEIVITFTDNADEGTTTIADITSDNIVTESMSLKQSICDEEALTFGGCIASELNIKLLNTAERQFTTELAGRWISVSITQYYADPENVLTPSSAVYPASNVYPGTQVSSHQFYVFSGYIDSATIDKTDKNVINIKAYDFLAKLHEEDATNFLFNRWWRTGNKNLMGNLSQCLNGYYVTAFDDSIYATLNETVVGGYVTTHSNNTINEYGHANNDWLNNQSKISKGELLRQTCELLGVFGFVEPNDGKGNFIMLKLNGTTETYNFYEKCETEDYQSTGYTDFVFDIAGSRTNKTEGGVYVDGDVLKGGLSDAYEYAADKSYDFTKNINLWENISTITRTSTDTDVVINSTSIGTRLALNADSTDYAGECAFSTYQPLTATLDGRLWVPIGSPIEILVNKTTPDGDYQRDPITGEYILDENGQHPKVSVKTYILSRTLTGIQALTDNITVKGVR